VYLLQLEQCSLVTGDGALCYGALEIVGLLLLLLLLLLLMTHYIIQSVSVTIQWWRRLMNAYEVKAGMVCLQRKKTV